MASPEISTQIVPEPKKPIQGRSFQNTLDFLAEATPTLRHLRTPWPPRHKYQTETNWQRNYTIAGRYLGTGESLDEIGREYHLTGERIRQIAKKAVIKIHANSSQEIQERFPLKSFDYDKYRTLEGKRRRSQLMGGVSLKIEELISQSKSIPEIIAEPGINIHVFNNARRTLKGWGIELPSQRELYHKALQKLQDPDLPDTEAQQILDTINRSVYHRLARAEKPVLIAISKVARGAGLFFASRDIKQFYLVLIESGIPVSSIPHQKTKENLGNHGVPRYYFIRSLDIDRVIKTLK